MMLEQKRCSMGEKRHPGITMHKLSFGGGFIGLLFAVGSALIFVLGFPTLWYFVALAFALGVGVAAFLRLTSRRSDDRNQPLSIMAAQKNPESRRPAPREKWHRLFFVVPRVFPASQRPAVFIKRDPFCALDRTDSPSHK